MPWETVRASAYDFTDDARVAILQARHEALVLGAREILPRHLALGVLRLMSPVEAAELLPEPGSREALYLRLGGRPEPAPVIARDIVYSDGAREALAGARHSAGAGTGAITPLHVLCGILSPRDFLDRRDVTPSEAAGTLDAAGVTLARLAELIAAA